MKTVALGSTDTRVPNVVAGMMRIAGSTDDQIRALYTTARESGINFFRSRGPLRIQPSRRWPAFVRAPVRRGAATKQR